MYGKQDTTRCLAAQAHPKGRMSILSLPRSVYDAVRTHCEEAYPRECCGALLGQHVKEGWQIAAGARATNARTSSARNRYEIAPAELPLIVREARGKGLDIAGFYHSHPDDPAQWPATDLAEVHWLGCS